MQACFEGKVRWRENIPETGTRGTAALTQALRTDVAIPKLNQGTAPVDAHAPAAQLGPPRSAWQEPSSSCWWSQTWDGGGWNRSGQGSGSEEGWQQAAPASSRATSVSSDTSARTKAQDKRARRHTDEGKWKSDQTQNLIRQYGKFCGIAASRTFQTTNAYYDQYIGCP